jgi:hypothetical protein
MRFSSHGDFGTTASVPASTVAPNGFDVSDNEGFEPEAGGQLNPRR